MCTILLDIDDVLADCSPVVHKFTEQLFDRELPGPEHWASYEFAEGMGLSGTESEMFEEVCKRASFPWHIGLNHGAKEFVEDLIDARFDVCFVTKPWAGLVCWVPAREKLLADNFPGIDVVYTGAKERVQGDILMDDSPHNIRKNLARAIIFDKPWNHGIHGAPRVHSYSEAFDAMKKHLAKF